jgi:5-methylcytosine-specific restriction endonuclease McrA
MYKDGKSGLKQIRLAALKSIEESRYVSQDLRKSIMERDGFRCVRCGNAQALDVDHAVPFSIGGKSDIDNLQILCRDCNSEKGARTWWGPTLLEKVLASGKTLEYIEALYKQQRFK